MGFFAYIIVGGLAGWIASIIMNRNAQMGIVANIVVGIIGANIVGFVMNFFGKRGYYKFSTCHAYREGR